VVSAISLFRVFPVGSGSPFITIKNKHHGVPIESFLFPDPCQTHQNPPDTHLPSNAVQQ
jgi:hypothetical protein